MNKDCSINEIMQPKEVAEVLGITLGYLYHMTMRREIPFYKPKGGKSSKIYFRRSEIVAYALSNKQESESELRMRAYSQQMKKGGSND